MGILLDALVCAVFVVALIVGVSQGFVKQLSKLLRGLVAFAGSIVLTALVISFLKPTPIFLTLAQGAAGWFTDDTMIIIVNSPDDLAMVLAQHNTLKILSGLSSVLYNDMVNISSELYVCNTLGTLLGYHIAALIFGFVLWILLLLTLRLMFKGLIGLMKEIIVMPAFKTLDRVLGGIWVLVFTYIIFIGIILGGIEAAILKFMPDSWATLENLIGNTTILLWVHDTNVIGQLIAGLLNVTIPSLSVPA